MTILNTYYYESNTINSLLSQEEQGRGRKSSSHLYNEKIINVCGTVRKTLPWCNDVLTKETAEYEKPRPFPKKELIVKEGESNDFSKPVVMEITTDSVGNFSFSLPPGKYFIVEDRKKDKTSYDNILLNYGKGSKNCSPIDTNCLKKWYEKPDAGFVIKNDSLQHISITYNMDCDCNVPCSYTKIRRK